MSRVKTFNATGIATDGRLYSGDLNLIQDHYADLANFAQTVDLATLRVGDSSLQLLKYGAAEFRMTGALRTDKIIRGLGGLYVGAFTTAARDALAQADRPYGIIILNSQKNRFESNFGTDVAPVWRGLAYGLDSFDTPAGFISGSSNLAGRPAANTVAAGSFWYVTDMDTVFRSNGATWDRMIPNKPGKVTWHTRAASPAGELVCNGLALGATAIYADLRAELIAEASPYGVTGTDPKIPNITNRGIMGLGGEAEFNAIGEIGGEKTHDQTIAELVPHAHGPHTSMLTSFGGQNFFAAPPGADIHADDGAVTDAEGGGNPFNVLDPYITLQPVIHL